MIKLFDLEVIDIHYISVLVTINKLIMNKNL